MSKLCDQPPGAAMRLARDDVAVTRERILDAAEELIRRIGHRKTTIADVASTLRMSRANVYRYYPTRDAIDREVYARIANTTLEAAREISLGTAPATVKLIDIFEAIYQHTQFRFAEERHVQELFVDAAHGGWEVMRNYFEQMAAIVEATIREGAGTGELEVDDTSDAARGATAAMISFVHPVLVEERATGRGDVKVELEAQVRFVMRALGKVPGQPAV